MNLTFLTLLQRTARACGLDPNQLRDELAECLATWIEARIRKAWHMALWPGTVTVEERAFRDLFSLAATYSLGAEVYDAASRTYYRAVQDGFSGQAIADTAYWEPVADMVRYVDFLQSGQTVIGDPLSASRHDPRKVAAPGGVTIWHDGGKVYVPSYDCPTLWLRFRRLAPRLTAPVFDADAIYAEGDVIYWADGLASMRGDCYRALTDTTAGESPESAVAKWERQCVPEILGDYAVRGAKADWLSDDGQDDKATTAEAFAERWLNDRLADVTILQAQN